MVQNWRNGRCVLLLSACLSIWLLLLLCCAVPVSWPGLGKWNDGPVAQCDACDAGVDLRAVNVV